MFESQRIQGRWIQARDLDTIAGLLQSHPQWSRRRLSVALAQLWDWRNEAGQLKDMAARTLLNKLEERQLVRLPPRQAGGGRRLARRAQEELNLGDPDPPILQEPLGSLLPLRLDLARTPAQRRLVEHLLRAHHYLDYQGPVGQNLQYLIGDRGGRTLGCAVFGAAAWKIAPRDRFIGWSAPQRERGLAGIANNSRFLLMPWVRVPCLASHVLSRLARAVPADWRAKYGREIYLLETFVDLSRYPGVCYRAANWIEVGRTQGRGRQNQGTAFKAIHLHPLRRDFRRLPCAG